MRKIIYTGILPFSETAEDYRQKRIYGGWCPKVARQVQKRSKKYAIECWIMGKNVSEAINFKHQGIRYRLFPCTTLLPYRSTSPQLIKTLKKEAKQHQILIHLHSYNGWLAYAFFKHFRDVPILVQHHGDTPPMSLLKRKPYLFPLLPLLLVETMLEFLYFRNIDHAFVNTPAAKKNLSKHISPKNIEVHTMGADFSEFRPMDKKKIRKKLGLPLDKKLVLYVGKYFPQKGVDLLLKSYPLLKKKGIEIIMIGGTSADPLYEQVKATFPFEFGVVPHKDLRQYYCAADAYVLLTDRKFQKWGGIGVAPIEAMACNTPAIGSTMYLMPNQDIKKCGKHINHPSEFIPSLLSVLNNPGKFSSCRKTAQKYYDWGIIVKRTLEVYSSLFKKYFGPS